ncbi:hypothetical protein PoB_002889100 [Plakobranchus ocellatus]|uniref:LITAF domain-containing protein n=1 Tax=Plakobranchus ocellatus TaxID=259542 RepID=A0AAV4A6T7_9GAST|nr:hypothetical protein PoB_002889100 [Plakobranchus ocellatus]
MGKKEEEEEEEEEKEEEEEAEEKRRSRTYISIPHWTTIKVMPSYQTHRPPNQHRISICPTCNRQQQVFANSLHLGLSSLVTCRHFWSFIVILRQFRSYGPKHQARS